MSKINAEIFENSMRRVKLRRFHVRETKDSDSDVRVARMDSLTSLLSIAVRKMIDFVLVTMH